MEKITNTFLGLSGVTAVEVVGQHGLPSIGDVPGIVQIVVQIVIGVFTLIGLFKKKKLT